MANHVSEVAKAIRRMDEQLRNDLLKKDERANEKALWEEKHREQVNKLNRGENSISDHIRAMVYSMLSSRRSWAGIEDKKVRIDKIFYNYNPAQLKVEPAENLEKQIRAISCGNQGIKAQTEALKGNIEKLEAFETKSGSIDGYYKEYLQECGSAKNLVKALSYPGKNKLVQFGVPLVCEYLRNVGYDLPKPDRHIRRILGSKILACSKNEEAGEFEVFDIIAELAQEMGKSAAEVDYILWTYCASGYGAVCTVEKPKCDICAAKEYCKKHN